MSRRLAVWIVLVILFAALVVGSAMSATEASSSLGKPIESGGVTYQGTVIQDEDGPDVAVVPVIGAITAGSTPPGGGTVGSEDLVRILDGIREDELADAVILELDTPGGGVLASAEAADAVKRLTDADIPVVAWMRDSAASGGYYIAAGADRIVAHPTTITGSIGVILEYPNLEGLAKKIGVKPVVIKSGKLKDIGSPYRDLTTEERALLQELIDEAYGDFVKTVDAGRSTLDKEEVLELADGRIYTGRQAKANGLVDELGGRIEAYEAAANLITKTEGNDGDNEKGAGLHVVRYSRAFGFWEGLGSMSGPALSLDSVAFGIQKQLMGGTGTPGTLGLEAGGGHNGLPALEYRAVL